MNGGKCEGFSLTLTLWILAQILNSSGLLRAWPYIF